MTLETKFSLGQSVFRLDKMTHKAVQAPIVEIFVSTSNQNRCHHRLYLLGGRAAQDFGATTLADRLHYAIDETKLFATKEELLASL